MARNARSAKKQQPSVFDQLLAQANTPPSELVIDPANPVADPAADLLGQIQQIVDSMATPSSLEQLHLVSTESKHPTIWSERGSM